jgi:purine catabolism regulator
MVCTTNPLLDRHEYSREVFRHVITLAQLSSRLQYPLEPVTAKSVSRHPVSGVHISELSDPTPYLDGGEFLLTTGIPLAVRGDDLRHYVQRLAQRKVAALGLGIGVGTDNVSAELVTACEEVGLELLVVPRELPFRHISSAYWDLASLTDRSDLISGIDVQTALARASMEPNAVEGVLRILVGGLGGWAAYLPVGLGPAIVWPRRAEKVLPALRDETARLSVLGPNSSATFQLDGSDVVEYPILVGRHVEGHLAVGVGRALSRTHRQVIMTACALLALKLQQNLELATASAVLESSVAKLLIEGHMEAARSIAPDAGILALPDRVRLLTIDGESFLAGTGRELARVVTSLEADEAWADLGNAVVSSRLRYAEYGVTYVILSAEPAHTSPDWELTPAPTKGAGHVSASLSRPVPIHRVVEILDTARQVALNAVPGRLVCGWGSGDTRAAGWVGSLAGYARIDLISTVRSYLKNRGNWEATAGALGLHRNSLRHRISLAEKLIGVSLDDPDVAAVLWIALRGRPDQET